MKIRDIFERYEKTFSFEFFPPRDEISAVDFGINVGQLIKLTPSFVSVTYGAGGSSQQRTFALVSYLQNKIGLTTMAHYTCVGAGRDKILDDMKHLYELGIENLMLLRGDPPKGENHFHTPENGFSHAHELIAFINDHYFFSIGGAAYPEKHPEAATLEEDIEHLKIKYHSGVDFLITQLFFDNEAYFNFVKLARNHGINCRVIPGIIPVTSYNQIKKILDLTAVNIPDDLNESINKYKNNPARLYQTGIDFAIQQCMDLLKRGAPGIHFYTLNKSRAAVEVYESLHANL